MSDNPYQFDFEPVSFVTRAQWGMAARDPRAQIVISNASALDSRRDWRVLLAQLKLNSPTEFRKLVRALWPRRDPFASRRVGRRR